MEWFRKLSTRAAKTYDKSRTDVSGRLRICCAGAAHSVSRRQAISSGRELH
jgi:hypothetical protein